MPLYRFAIVTLINGLFLFSVVSAAAGVEEPAIFQLLSVSVALMIVVLGNLMSTLRPNYFVGIRTPWTLEDESVWKSTHRLAGKLWVMVGLLLLPASIMLPWTAFSYVLLIGVALMVGYPVIYSFLAFIKLAQ